MEHVRPPVFAASLLPRLAVMDTCEPLGVILFWDEYDVHLWISRLGLPQYEEQIREHHITGDILVQLDADALKEIGVESLGQRLRILKAIYQVKVAQGIDVEPGDYVPPSELESPQSQITRPELDGAQVSPATMSRDPLPHGALNSVHLKSSNLGNSYELHPILSGDTVPATALPAYTPEPPGHRECVFSDAYASTFGNDKKGKVSAEDPVSKVLPVALRKHNITGDWRNYVMFIRYGQTEIRLGYDDKPRRIFKALQKENMNPILVLKHISDISEAESPYPISRDSHPGATYAVAIHPYKTRSVAPSNVVPGDAFVVVSKTREKWFVQRDPSGIGMISNALEHVQIPPGCLLETDVPIAFAFAAAFAARTSSIDSPVCSPSRQNNPVLPRNIISTGYTSIALSSYRKSDDNGTDLSCGDIIHVFKRYKHLAYLVKEDGDRGWVPSSLVSRNYRSL